MPEQDRGTGSKNLSDDDESEHRHAQIATDLRLKIRVALGQTSTLQNQFPELLMPDEIADTLNPPTRIDFQYGGRQYHFRDFINYQERTLHVSFEEHNPDNESISRELVTIFLEEIGRDGTAAKGKYVYSKPGIGSIKSEGGATDKETVERIERFISGIKG